MRLAGRFAGVALLALAAASATQAALPAALSPPGSLPAENAQPETAAAQPIPVADVAEQAEKTSARLRALVAKLETLAEVGTLEAGIAEAGGRIWSGVDDTQKLLDQGPRLSIVNDLIEGWTVGRRRVAAHYDAVTLRAREATQALDQIKQEREVWKLTEAAARDADAPPTVLTRITTIEADLDRTKLEITTLRDRIFELQDQAARQLAICDEVLDRITGYRTATAGALGLRTSPPLWDPQVFEDARKAAQESFLLGGQGEIALSLRFLRERAPVILGFLLFLVVSILLLRAARARAARLVEQDSALRDLLRVLERPYSVAVLLTLVVLLWSDPGLPHLFGHTAAVISYVPVLRILRQTGHPGLNRLLSALVVLLAVDRIREFVAISPLLEQVVLSLDMAAGLALVLYALRPSRLQGVTLRAREVGWAQALAWLLRFLGVAFAVALAAAVSGYMPLARTAAFVPLSMIYGATAFYAVTRAIFAVTALLLRVQPLVRLRTMQAQRDMVERRTRRVVGWIAVASWLYMIRANLTSIGVPGDALQRIADVDLVLGSLRLTVGDVVAFGVTVWASFLLSRFVRFVLGEEVFPRMQMAHGLPYALSSLIHYAILLVGFFVALASLGFDSSRMAVLVGALGVGVGFGLQAIVNNFVSGLILLFERPIQIGDTVQIGDVTGDVKRIGIRSSTVRTWAGAEVIVPNSSLISERVTNWTLSDRSRRFELQLGVAYGTSPAEMLVLLTEVARKHTEILAYPEPIALFLGFGDSALNFELRAWVHDGNRVAIVKSEITVALLDALAAAGVSVPFPQREVHVIADGDAKAPATPRG